MRAFSSGAAPWSAGSSWAAASTVMPKAVKMERNAGARTRFIAFSRLVDRASL
jgi:hypothetical protein